MKQYKRKITAAASAILIALTVVGFNADQAIAQGKSGRRAKARAGSDARIAKTQGQAKLHLEDISLGAMDNPQAKRRSARNGGGGNAKSIVMEEVLVSGVKSNSRAKRRSGSNGKVRAGWDIRQPKL